MPASSSHVRSAVAVQLSPFPYGDDLAVPYPAWSVLDRGSVMVMPSDSQRMSLTSIPTSSLRRNPAKKSDLQPCAVACGAQGAKSAEQRDDAPQVFGRKRHSPAFRFTVGARDPGEVFAHGGRGRGIEEVLGKANVRELSENE